MNPFDKKKIVLDCDGVIADIYTPALYIIRDKFKDSINRKFSWEMAQDWEMSTVDYEVKDYFFRLVADPYYISTLKPYPNAIKGIKQLQGLAKEYNYEVIINTAVYNEPAREAREKWLRRLQKYFLDTLPFYVQVSSKASLNNEKPVFDAVAVVDDNLYVLQEQMAPFCYIIDHAHNREATNSKFRDVFDKSIRCRRLLDVVADLRSKLDLYKR